MTEKLASNQHRELHYGDIRLVPVDNGFYPYTAYSDSWHVPGWRRYGTTEELVKLASKRGITVRVVESSSGGRTTFRLN